MNSTSSIPLIDADGLRVLIAPMEIAGQMRLLANELRKKGHNATSVNYYQNKSLPGQGNDRYLGFVSGQRTMGRAVKTLNFFRHAMLNYDVFHFFWGESLLPGNMDLPILKAAGKKIFVHFRGSDIRQRSYLDEVMERRRQELPMDMETPLSSPAQIKKLERWRKNADEMFVSIPELVKIVPEARVVQQVIDLSEWDFCPEGESIQPEELVIAHATTSWGTKGTEFIVQAVDQLKAKGYSVRLELIENRPLDQVREIYRTSHIGVDGLLQGSYGNVSIELMAMGKPVVAYLDDWYMEHRPDLPVVNATPTDLAKKLGPLIESQTARIELGRRGREYVERWHEVGRITDDLVEIYRT